MLSPHFINQREAFDVHFPCITSIPFTYEDFEQTREMLVKEIHSNLSERDHKFILSFVSGDPDWEVFPLDIIRKLPAVKWKLKNLQKLIKNNPEKHLKLYAVVEEIFNK